MGDREWSQASYTMQEMMRVLVDKLDEKMKGTPAEVRHSYE